MRRVFSRLLRLAQSARASDTNRGKVVDSAAWTLGERVLTLGGTWVVSIVVANHLGLADFGLLSYTVALVALFVTFVTAGLSGLVVRDLVRRPDERDSIMGTVFLIRACSGVLCFAALIGSTFLFGTDQSGGRVLAVIVGVGMFLRATDVVEFWFQAETRLRYVSMVNMTSAVVGGLVRLLLVAFDGSLVLFACAVAFEQIVASAAFFVAYRAKGGHFRRWKFERGRAGAYLRTSWPLILSGAANTVNRRADLVLLGVLLSTSAVGTYAIAARLSEIWYFVPMAIAGAVFPSLIRAKALSEELYRRRLRQLYALFLWGAIGLAVVVSLLAEPVISALYSEQFSGAAAVLVIHVWAAPFLFINVIFSKWLIIENLLMTSLVRHGLGATLNIGLNLILIPAHGPKGAAVATLVSYATATYFACFLSKRTWPAAVDMTLGLLMPFRMVLNSLDRRSRAPASILEP